MNPNDSVYKTVCIILLPIKNQTDLLHSRTPVHSLFAKRPTRFSKCNVPNSYGESELTEAISSTGKDELLETAMALHEAAMKDGYFIKRKLAPNVDFWWVVSIRSRME